MARLAITQTRSAINTKPAQRKTLAALGLGRRGRTVELEETPQLKGQIRVVEHLVQVEEA